jgi:hypothetical protein
VKLFRGRIGGIVFSLQEMCFFLRKKNVTFERFKITEKKTMRQQL